MAATDTSRLLRWSRWAIAMAAVIMALALVIPSWFGLAGARSSRTIVARGQGQALVEGIIGRMQAISARPTPADLEEILEALKPSGLRYLSLQTRKPLQAGTPSGPEPALRHRLGPTTISQVGERMRMTTVVPPPRPRGPPRRRAGPPGRGPLPLIIEFDPGPANELISRARTSLLINALVAIGILLTSGLAFFYLRRHEYQEVVRVRERHLASLGEMSAVLAHEIRNPLASLKGHAQLLSESLDDAPKKKSKAERVVGEAIRLETLTTNLLDFVRTGSIKRVQISPITLVTRACEATDSGRIQIDTAHAPDSWPLDSQRMQQALENLIRNALQASSDADVTVHVSSFEQQLIFEIRDQGPGITNENLDKIFEPFHTTKTPGTGLGLAIARRVVELHGGTISAHNSETSGAVFRIAIPRT